MFTNTHIKDDLGIAQALTWRYVLALSLVAALTTAAWYSLKLVISEQESTAAVVNISGRQRMLSQRTALFANLLVTAHANERASIRTKLEESIELMAISHHGLLYGNKVMGLPSSMSPAVRAMYFEGDYSLNKQVRTYINTVRALIATDRDKLSPDNAALRYITNTAPTTLVSSLDKAVHQYQLEGEASIKQLEKAETALWILTLLLLSLEAMLIFNPFIKHIKVVINKLKRATDEILLNQETLEERIKQRTSELANRSKALAESEQRLSILLNNTNIHMWAFDGTSFTYTNKQWFDFTGQNPEDSLTVEKWTSVVHPKDIAEAQKIWQVDFEKKTGHDHYFRLKRHDGVYRDFYCRVTPIEDENGKLLYLQGHNLDITDRKKLEDEVRQLAFYDALTKLPNRRLLKDRLGQTLASSKRNARYCALMFLDLDNFKPINDTYGHAFGDALLVEVAGRIKSCVRQVDTVSRFGGDEFIVLLNTLSKNKEKSIHQANRIAEKIRKALLQPYLLSLNTGDSKSEIEHLCSASIGVVVFIHHELNEDEILKRADDAMYVAKSAGRNQIKLDSDFD
ncbi:diguanylate cyclase domain-containing protein [Methylotenera sp.]|uniref:diguanylate cyclase domain-containing protein n=1 Tax=Methylotenera sp. TaxID=2051956 RepID=UPI0027335CB3|nr:diguanylate cyclase [Methylotenera sp.]MDP3212251.1 diguanylate cyclase [Methylotenera sp.]MDP3777120.1 diguanylate cyclase [Methylotenera sp.]